MPDKFGRIKKAGELNKNNAVSLTYMHNTFLRKEVEIDMNRNRITNLGVPIDDGDAIPKSYTREFLLKNQEINMSGNKITNLQDPVQSRDAVNKQTVERILSEGPTFQTYYSKDEFPALSMRRTIELNEIRLERFDRGFATYEFTINFISTNPISVFILKETPLLFARSILFTKTIIGTVSRTYIFRISEASDEGVISVDAKARENPSTLTTNILVKRFEFSLAI